MAAAVIDTAMHFAHSPCVQIITEAGIVVTKTMAGAVFLGRTFADRTICSGVTRSAIAACVFACTMVRAFVQAPQIIWIQ